MNILTFDGKQYALISQCNQVLVEVRLFVFILRFNNTSTLLFIS